ncbi:MAG: ribonuclease III [Malacoplasma sp.]|nr:ribonuclease III [Malacoplasma sp.]
MKRIIKLLDSLGIKTKNLQLYAEAMTHNSYKNEAKVSYTYQRLEFLGDAIISKIISCYLFYLKMNEHEMTDIRKMLVNADTLKRASDELNLINFAFLGKGINLEKDTRKIKEDLFESLIGAIYLDKGEIEVYKILKRTLIKYLKGNQLSHVIDYKSKLQELFQGKILNSKNAEIPYYQTIETDNKKFKTILYVNNVKLGTGFGATKKEAEKSAAKKAYQKFAYPNNS